jgi:hypothetical protein
MTDLAAADSISIAGSSITWQHCGIPVVAVLALTAVVCDAYCASVTAV